MQALIHLAKEIQIFFHAQKWNFCFIGGLALQQWGEPRLTQDVDVSLLTGFGREEAFITRILKKYPSRIPDGKLFALQRRVLLVQNPSGIGIDISLCGLPFEEAVVDRAEFREFLKGISLKVCSAEDLIVFKGFADRLKDWADIEGIIIRQGNSLDWKYIKTQLEPLCELKEAPHIVPRILELKKKLESPIQ